MTEHVCTERCTHRVTAETLTALGFPVRKTEKICGCTYTVVEGMTFEAARHAATEAGLLRTCTRTAKLGG